MVTEAGPFLRETADGLPKVERANELTGPLNSPFRSLFAMTEALLIAAGCTKTDSEQCNAHADRSFSNGQTRRERNQTNR
jgi:hypothetical protein